jgi:hypothetical protein
MMHEAHAHFSTPATPGLDAAHAASPACDVPGGDHAGTVWWTVVDFIRAVVEARANAHLGTASTRRDAQAPPAHGPHNPH